MTFLIYNDVVCIKKEMTFLIYNDQEVKKFGKLYLHNDNQQPWWNQILYIYDAKKEILSSNLIKNNDIMLFFNSIKNSEIEGISLCLLLNPRSAMDAFGKLQREYIKYQTDMIIKGKSIIMDLRELDKTLITMIYNSINKKIFVELYTDTKDNKIVDKVKEFIYEEKIKVHSAIETGKGYRIIFESNKINEVKIRELCKRQNQTYINTDPQPPIPGTVQYGYRVKFTNIFEFPNVNKLLKIQCVINNTITAFSILKNIKRCNVLCFNLHSYDIWSTKHKTTFKWEIAIKQVEDTFVIDGFYDKLKKTEIIELIRLLDNGVRIVWVNSRELTHYIPEIFYINSKS
jgi:hypothetical protein